MADGAHRLAGPEDVAIVGMAAMFPGAPDLGRFWRNIVGGVDAVTEVPDTRWDSSYYDPNAWAEPASDRFYCRRGGFIDDIATFDPSRFGIMPVAVDGTEPDQLLALKVASDAIFDAGGDAVLGDRTRVAVIVGRGGYLSAGGARLDQRVRAGRQLVASLRELVPDLDAEQLERVGRDFQERLGPERPESSIGLVPNLAASRIANRLDLQGPAYTVDAACASSLVAIDHAVFELASGRCDTVIAGGVHVCDDVTLWSVFSQLRALSPSQNIRPFDRRADGILIGEGTGMMVLKRLGDAERDGDRVYAVIRGVGISSDGRDSSLMRPRVEGQVLALERAWAAAGLDPTAPDAVDMVEAHGTATVVGDQAELTTLLRVFGTAGSPIGLGSVKSMIGHAMPAAGIAGLIKAALAVHHGTLPPTLHCEEPHPAMAGTRLAPLIEAHDWEVAGGSVRRAAVNAFGFGGINAHVIVEALASAAVAFPTPAPTMEAQRPAGDRVLLLAGRDLADLAGQLAVPDAALLGRDDLGRAPAGGSCRLAVVDPTPTRLELARKVVSRGRPWRGRNDVWFTAAPLLASSGAGGGKVAFLFPGIEQTFDPQIDGIAAHFGLPDPSLAGAGNLGRQGVGTVLVGRLLDAALRRLGIVPDLVAGHSIGEWNAMISAGMYDVDAVDAFIGSFDTDAVEVPGVVFAALGCGAEAAEMAIAGLDQVVVSHDNCPHQSIICGEEASVDIALERLRAGGVMGQVLNFRSGFHSPMLEPYLGPVGDLLTGLRLQPAQIPVWSATTVAPYPDDLDEVRHLVVRHLLEAVRFGPLVRRLHDDGVRAFVQVGSGSLTGFIDDTLRDRDQLVISASSPKHSGLDQLRRVAAALWVEGRSSRLDLLAVSPPAPAESKGVHLRLGTPLVSFGAGATPLVIRPSTPAAPVPAAPPAAPALAGSGNPLMSEFDAVLRDATAAAGAVMRTWSAGPQPRPAAQAAVVPTPTKTSTSVVLSTENMPYLLDHCFYRQPDGWTDVADRFPVVPMTTMLELMMDAARPLIGERVIVGLRKVRALRWLAITKPVTLRITTSPGADGNVDVVLEGFARGTVVVADRYPPAPERVDEALRSERPSEISARQLYDDRWLFHGPDFQGVTRIDVVGDNGIRGELESLAASGGLLDNAGQLMGFWIRTNVAVDKLAFPATIEQLEFFAPHPEPGRPVGCTVWIRTMTDTAVKADLELRGADGTVWARITGWEDRRFTTDSAVDPILRWPENNRIAEPQPGGWFLLRDRWPDPANRELIMRRYLTAAERERYDAQSPRSRHRWLLGRMVVKDAVRQSLWDQGAGPLFPAEFTVDNAVSGQPSVRGRVKEPLDISIAHTGELAVAIVGPQEGNGVGIDVEVVEPRSPQFETMAFSDGERALLDRCAAAAAAASGGPSQADARLEWMTRFWCAKEAVAKAEGTGLGGLPQRFVIERLAGDRILVSLRDDPHRRARWVETRSLAHLLAGPNPTAKLYVAAWTLPVMAADLPTTLMKESTTNGR